MIATDSKLDIRLLSRVQLPLCVPFGRDFHKELKLAGEFKPSVFLRNWQTFYDRYPATVIGLWDDLTLVGGLGCMVIPDLCDGRLCVQEMFWFVGEHYRQGLGAIRLMKKFEEWGREQGAVEARMVHLLGGQHDEQLDRIYRKRKYKPIETCYGKSLDPVPVKEDAWLS